MSRYESYCMMTISAAMKLSPVAAIPLIEESTDRAWLSRFRANLASVALSGDTAATHIVAGLDRRLLQLDIGLARPNMTFVERVEEAIRVYEQFLALKHGGKRVKAARTRRMIEVHGPKEAVTRMVRNMRTSPGLELLHEHGRLDCAYELVVLDFPDVFNDPMLVDKARANLASLTRGT